MPRISPPAASTRSFQCVGLALLLAVTAPARALEAKGAVTPTIGRTASAHRLLRDPEGLASWLGDQSPVVRAARARARQASADVASSHLFPNPVLDASLSNVPITTTTPAGLTFGETAIYGVGLSQTF
ncbi:MAG TPA: hypothetical protein VFV94_09190, partial [Polyangiaceae bacterium]|nr:hypothetical protein [Polyangiaceae bacterium]